VPERLVLLVIPFFMEVVHLLRRLVSMAISILTLRLISFMDQKRLVHGLLELL
jgi:hypothetical protein